MNNIRFKVLQLECGHNLRFLPKHGSFSTTKNKDLSFSTEKNKKIMIQPLCLKTTKIASCAGHSLVCFKFKHICRRWFYMPCPILPTYKKFPYQSLFWLKKTKGNLVLCSKAAISAFWLLVHLHVLVPYFTNYSLLYRGIYIKLQYSTFLSKLIHTIFNRSLSKINVTHLLFTLLKYMLA